MNTSIEPDPRRRSPGVRHLLAAAALAPALALANIPPIPFHELRDGDDLAGALAEVRMAETEHARRDAADEEATPRERRCDAPTPIPDGGRRLP
jgi:hypothetical protein